MRDIVQQNSPVLRQKAKEVPPSEIASDAIQNLLADMREALDAEYDGVGLAAPQLGESLRIFIVSELVYKKGNGEEDAALAVKGVDEKSAKKSGEKATATKAAMKSVLESATKTSVKTEPLVFINPEIVKSSKDKKSLEEGCLSVRPLYGKVRRATKVVINAYDEFGQRFERGASGLLAQVFQHEIDHLNGVLFIDKAKDIHEMDVEENKRAIAAKTAKTRARAK